MEVLIYLVPMALGLGDHSQFSVRRRTPAVSPVRPS